MNNEKKIKPWEPLKDLADAVHISSIYDNDDDGFKIILVEDGNKTRRILINFGASVSAYRVTDELIAMHILDGYSIELFENGESRPWSLFTVTNSEYLKWASDQSDTVSEALGLVHYFIWTEYKMLEILSWGTPKVEFIDII